MPGSTVPPERSPGLMPRLPALQLKSHLVSHLPIHQPTCLKNKPKIPRQSLDEGDRVAYVTDLVLLPGRGEDEPANGWQLLP